ncbi:tyrosine-type recombinase/integrase [Bacteroides intestinalis]|uniref:tyrosine-type recombinase/integrase n=1 Tax=Bacteroides intestinalis TaxID=329854 RepID=UPI0011C38A40|nr:phage integrase SAM-like domain-containing protein [Bacteroides intestinalis]
MIENEININGCFKMRVNFNLKNIGGSKSQIMLTTTINGERTRIYTGLLIEPQFWIKTSRTEIGERANENTSLGRVQCEYNHKINLELRKILGFCREYGVEVSQNHLAINHPMIHSKDNFETFVKSKIRGIEANIRKNPVEFINDYIQRKSKMVNKDTQRRIVSGTVYNHKNALRRLKQFCDENRLRIVWELFDARLEENFTSWMMDRGYSANTIASQYSIMKVWLTEAEIEGLIVNKAFHRYTTKTQDVDNIYLSEDEIQRIYNIDFSDEAIISQVDFKSSIEQTRDLFVIACWSGLRFGDWRDLSRADLTADTMTITTSKTNKTVVIPLHPLVKNIIQKYGGKLPMAVDKTHALKQIRKCGELANITEEVSLGRVIGGQTVIRREPKYNFIMNHTARRAFATNMYLRNVPSISIMAITGHTTEANFLKYIKISQSEHAAIVAKAFAV